ncbi:hypothetical protein Bbelb_241660 [Branchiostoma belcheri]|nr:hypothetical protein Bbelb_241660 [Branchiostoma belcheri]
MKRGDPGSIPSRTRDMSGHAPRRCVLGKDTLHDFPHSTQCVPPPIDTEVTVNSTSPRIKKMWQLLLSVCLIGSLTLTSAQITPVSSAAFYPYGPGTGDILDPPIDDGTSGAQSLSTPYPFFGNTYSSLYVNTNGDISFGSEYRGFSPVAFPTTGKRLLAVYFTDLITSYQARSGYIYHRETTDAGLLARATTDIRTAFPAEHGSFVATWVYIATWHDIAFFSYSSIRNTFQLVLITDGQKSFALFNYYLTRTTRLAQVGINGGNGIHFSFHPYSRTTDLASLPTWTDPAVPGPPGRWYQRTDLATVGGIVDIDACLSNVCHVNATCTDLLPPSPDANCSCTTGYTGDGRVNGTGCTDINACSNSSNPCHSQATCTDNPAPALDANCTCNVGYTGDGFANRTGCTDVDECARGTDNCGTNATCTNTPGSFTCTCDTGYSGNGVNCTDLDACSNSSNPCHAQATCTDQPAPSMDATCTCKDGFMGDGRVNGTGCLDINACLANPCHANATCTDNPAPSLDASCTCNVGYTGDGRVNGSGCSDINACLFNPCHANATCTDNPAPALDASCTCNVGYTGDGRVNGTGCSDINTCSNSSNPCHALATCTDNPAPAIDATCTCNVGYTGDGFANRTGCTDRLAGMARGMSLHPPLKLKPRQGRPHTNACLANPCHANATCTDNPAPALDANCTCNVGYAGDGRVNGTGCLDIDTCSNSSNPCHAQATCTDNPAPALDASCACNVGYTGDGFANRTGCTDVNSCSPNPCHANATCTDNPAPALDASCTCHVGYTGDGRVNGTGCSDINACLLNPCHANATCTDNPAPALDAICTCNAAYTGDGLLNGTGCRVAEQPNRFPDPSVIRDPPNNKNCLISAAG